MFLEPKDNTKALYRRSLAGLQLDTEGPGAWTGSDRLRRAQSDRAVSDFFKPVQIDKIEITKPVAFLILSNFV